MLEVGPEKKKDADNSVNIKGVNATEPLLMPISPDQPYHNNGNFSAILEYIEENDLNVILIIADRTLTLQMDGTREEDEAKTASDNLQSNWMNKNLLGISKNKNLSQSEQELLKIKKDCYQRLMNKGKISVRTIDKFDQDCKEKYKEKYLKEYEGKAIIEGLYHQPCNFLHKLDLPSTKRSIVNERVCDFFPNSSGSAYILTPTEFFYIEDMKNHDTFTEADRIACDIETIGQLENLKLTFLLSPQDLEAITFITAQKNKKANKHNPFRVAVQEARDNFCKNSEEKNSNNPSFDLEKAKTLSETYILAECDSILLWGNFYTQMAYPMNENITNKKIFSCINALKKKTDRSNTNDMGLLDLSIAKAKKSFNNKNFTSSTEGLDTTSTSRNPSPREPINNGNSSPTGSPKKPQASQILTVPQKNTSRRGLFQNSPNNLTSSDETAQIPPHDHSNDHSSDNSPKDHLHSYLQYCTLTPEMIIQLSLKELLNSVPNEQKSSAASAFAVNTITAVQHNQNRPTNNFFPSANPNITVCLPQQVGSSPLLTTTINNNTPHK